MNYTYHIITPFSRWENFLPLAKLMHREGVWWNLIFDRDVPVHFMDMWIGAHYCDPCPNGFFPGYWKTNWFLDHGGIWNEDARYLVLNDDDFYEPGFFEKIDEVKGELLICSMGRGQHQPPGSPHPGGVLEACPENLKVGYVGGEQLIVSGRLLKPHRYGPHYEADGELILKLAAETPPVFVPQAQVWFNYFEPGRWDK